VPKKTLDKLQRYDTPTVCNVIELFAVRPQTEGYMDGRIRSCFPEMGPICGYASTATFRSALKPSGSVAYGTLSEQVDGFAEVHSPPIVVIQDLDDPTKAATFGEVMAATYKSFGVAGLITSGAARDLDQVRDVGLPCFADGVICSHGYPKFIDFNVPVHIGGLAVYPGDLLHADQNGVANVPREIVGEVADVCEEFCAAEAVVLDYCAAGDVTADGYAAALKELGARVAGLRQRLR
jgi:regulator of RNase E activity RraA